MHNHRVYRLYRDDVCVYVGSSTNLRARITSHKHRNACDRWDWELLPVPQLHDREQQLIDQLSPQLNRAKTVARVPRHSSGAALCMTISLNNEDMACLREIQAHLESLYGKTTIAAVLRYALRRAVMELKKGSR